MWLSASPAITLHNSLLLLSLYFPTFPSIQAVVRVFAILFLDYFFTSIFWLLIVFCFYSFLLCTVLFLHGIIYIYCFQKWLYGAATHHVRPIFESYTNTKLYLFFTRKTSKLFIFDTKIGKLTYCIIFWSFQKLWFLK